jgi:hypothetical protein
VISLSAFSISGAEPAARVAAPNGKTADIVLPEAAGRFALPAPSPGAWFQVENGLHCRAVLSEAFRALQLSQDSRIAIGVAYWG